MKIIVPLIRASPRWYVFVLVYVFIFLLTPSGIAQPGIAELNQAKAELTRSFFSARDATLVLATLLGLCGAVNIYYNWQMGKDKVTAKVAAWFFAAFFMILLGPFLQVLFGI